MALVCSAIRAAFQQRFCQPKEGDSYEYEKRK